MKLATRSIIKRLFPDIQIQPGSTEEKQRPYTVVQVEVTSRCSTGCVFCPHDAISDQWVEGDLSLELYRAEISPHLDLFDLVYLQGWGEPMLHPHLWEMLELAQRKGCRTGFTTNGAWLEDDQNRRLIDQGINLVSVSFAGQAPLIHETLRTNSNFTELCRNFASLSNLKQKKGADKPWLELHFLMTSINLGEFPKLVELAATLGADEMVATNLTYSPNLTLDQTHVFADQPLVEDIEVINQAREAARHLNIPLRIYPLQVEARTLVCDADPLNAIYINHRGEVSPCVYLGLTTQGEIPRYYLGESHPYNTVSFGNISAGLITALNGKERDEFTAAFKQRNASRNPLALFAYMASQDGANELPLPPAPCQYCYKMIGV